MQVNTYRKEDTKKVMCDPEINISLVAQKMIGCLHFIIVFM